MSTGKVRHIHKLSDEETEKLVNIGVHAFKDAVSARAMVGGNDDLLPLQFRSIARAAGLEGETHVVTNEANEIVSYAIWFPPGTDLFASEAQRRLGFNEMMEKIDNDTRQWFKDTYSYRNAAWVKKWLPKPTLDCWWLAVLATDPDHQRRGYASLLMNHAIDTIPAPNIIGLVSTSHETADYYENIGIPVRDRMIPDMPSKVGKFPVFGHYFEATSSS